MANREIKFRGKRIDNREWIFGLPKYGSSGNINYICGWFGEEGFEQYDEIEVDPKTVGQYCGLKDKAGKEIYECDQLKNPEGKIGIVIFDDGCFRLQIHKSETSIHYITLNQGFVDNKIICGNIYEHPELLK